jgi:hypothetical protein
MILMDVSHYMYRYDYATFSLSVQNLEDVMVLMFRLLTRRREEGKEEKEETGKEEEGREERQEMRISVYACAVENPELYVLLWAIIRSFTNSRDSRNRLSTNS